MTTSADSAPGPWSREYLLLIVLVLVGLAVAYGPVFSTLVSQWSSNDTYSFGVLVPFISAYLVWSRRDSLRRCAVAPSLVGGGVLLLLAAALLLVGRLAAIIDVQEISLILMLVALVALLLGFEFLRELRLPLAYLLLMLPVWEVLTDRMHLPSQIFSATIAHSLLTSIGVPVYHDGVFLNLPNITLEVASACSGVNFLIAVIAVGIPQAYLYLQGWLPRAFAIGFAIAIALLSNGLRVAIIGTLSYFRLSEAVHGPGHILQGLFVSSFGFIALLGAVSILAKRYPRQGESSPVSEEPAPLVLPRWRALSAAALATGVLTFLAIFHPMYEPAGRLRTSLRELGANWRPLAGSVPVRFVASGTTQDMFTRAFVRTATGERVELFLGAFIESAPHGGVAYRSIVLPDAAMQSRITLPSHDGEAIQANRALIRQAESETEVIYWYDGDGWTSSYARTAKAYASAHVLTRLGMAPTLVVAVVDRPRRSTEEGDELLVQFANDVSRALNDAEAAQAQ
jgi:exosortase